MNDREQLLSLRRRDEIKRLQARVVAQRKDLRELRQRTFALVVAAEKCVEDALAYDAAINVCANDPAKMASFCTARGSSLDNLYACWIASAHGLKHVVEGTAS